METYTITKCALCEDTGIYNRPNGDSDFDAEYCSCDEGIRKESNDVDFDCVRSNKYGICKGHRHVIDCPKYMDYTGADYSFNGNR